MRQLSGNPARSRIKPRFAAPGPPPEPHEPAPFILDLSPQLHHSGSTTLHSPTLRTLAPAVTVRVSPRDARELGISDGSMVQVVEGGTRILLQARLDDTLRRGTVAVMPASFRERGVDPCHGECRPRRVRLETV